MQFLLQGCLSKILISEFLSVGRICVCIRWTDSSSGFSFLDQGPQWTLRTAITVGIWMEV